MSGVFTPAEIREAWQYAELAYRPAVELSSIFGGSLTIIEPALPDLGDACYLINEGDRVVVMFPGSDDALDWVRNLDAREEHGLHTGFACGLDALAEEILERIGQLRPATILITGHSRGGALADMMLELYAHHLIDSEIDCITFAQPRIATAEFFSVPCAKQMPGVRYLRVHTEHDPVADLPPLRLGWTHYGPSLQIGRRLSRWQQLLRWWGGVRSGNAMAMACEDHLVGAYREAVRQYGLPWIRS